MIVLTDNWKERQTKNGETYYNFNVSIDAGDVMLYTMGWQLFNGVINPPSFRSGWRFYPMMLTGGGFARLLWDELNDNATRIKLGLKLRPFEEAVTGITATAMDFARLFPNS